MEGSQFGAFGIGDEFTLGVVAVGGGGGPGIDGVDTRLGRCRNVGDEIAAGGVRAGIRRPSCGTFLRVIVDADNDLDGATGAILTVAYFVAEVDKNGLLWWRRGHRA